MPNHKSAEKRDRQRVKRRLRNRQSLGQMRTAIKQARAAVDAKAENASELVRDAMSRIDRAVRKGVIHRGTGSRYISRLSRRESSSAEA